MSDSEQTKNPTSDGEGAIANLPDKENSVSKKQNLSEEDILTSEMEKKLKLAKKFRKINRSRATKNINIIDDLLNAEILDIHKIKARVEILESIKSNLLHYDEDIQVHLYDDEFENDVEECEERQVAITEILSKVKDKFEAISSSKSTSKKSSTHNRQSHVSGQSQLQSVIIQSQTGFNNYQLPQIKLPTFAGDILEFDNFIQHFTAAMEGRNMSDIAKFQLLLSSLKGPAKNMVSGLRVIGENYEKALNTLITHFSNRSRLVEKLIYQLADLNAPKNDYGELYKFKSDILCFTESLKSQEHIQCDSCSTIISTLLARKLPDFIQEKTNWDKARKGWTLEFLHEIIDKALAMLEASGHTLIGKPEEPQASKNITQTKTKSTNKSSPRKEKPSTILVASENQQVNNPQSQQSNNKNKNGQSRPNNNNNNVSDRTCRFCNGNHYSSNCNVFPNLQLRLEKIKYHKWCEKCLSGKHTTENHQYEPRPCFNCKSLNHNNALCPKLWESQNDSSSISPSPGSLVSKTTVTSGKGVALPLADLRLEKGKNKYLMVRTLVDQGSQKTMIKRSVAKLISYTSHGKTITAINGFNLNGKFNEYELITFNIMSEKGLIPIKAMVVEHLPSELYIPGLVKTTKLLRKQGVQLANPYPYSDKVTDIALLIGSDNLRKLEPSYSTFKNIDLLNTNVGSLIYGEIPHSIPEPEVQVNIISVFRTEINSYSEIQRNSEELHSLVNKSNFDTFVYSSDSQDDLARLWDLSHIGISPEEPLTKAEESTLESFRDGLTFQNGQYVVNLPWKADHPTLPDNYALSKQRLYSVIKKLRCNPELLSSYDQVIKDQLERDFIEEVTPLTPLHPESKLHYLPHHGVRKNSSTTALRLVFDCSSNKPSLNDCLLSGPSLLTDLGKLLLKFRLKKYATSSDIEKAFLGIRISPKDRDSTRFLWFRDPSDPHSPLTTYRFKSVLFGATCSPFLLTACLQYHVNNSNTKFKSIILDQIYVDNLFGTFDNESEVLEFFNETRSLFQKAGLNLREWATNSEVASSFIETQNLGVEDDQIKVLGLLWDYKGDSLLYSQKPLDSKANTKRSILKNLASVFDPHGFLSAITIRGKILLQQLWKNKFDWDEKIPTELVETWETIVKHLNYGAQIVMPRQIIFSNDVEVHAFSDASGVAYTSVLYVISKKEKIKTSHILIAKSKVAPVKQLTVPRLELMGALLSSRLIKYVMSAFVNLINIVNVYCWCDSQITLQWLHSTKQLPTFNQNRVDEIKTNIPNAQWRYVPTKENPADASSRGSSGKYVHSKFWIFGPEWLTDPSQWPEWREHPSFNEPEPSVTVSLIQEEPLTPLIVLSNYSSLDKVFRITSLVFLFITNLKNKVGKKTLFYSTIKPKFSHNFLQEELQRTEKYWIFSIQRDSFPKELECLKERSHSAILIKQLNLILIDGIIRCDRRLQNASLPPDTKFPILLPYNHPFVSLLIWKTHIYNHHVGISQLISIIREKYYFSRMRQIVKKIIRPCVLCKRLQAVSFRPVPLSALPHSRVSETRAFSVIGVDYTGFFNVTTPKHIILKCYIVLFTCAVTRAVHLELAFDNSADSFIGVLRRFISRRGIPTIIYSDNATYFHASSDFLKSISSFPSVKEFFIKKSIIWRFNPARASHFGGFFERLIGLTKKYLKKILQTSLVTYEDFLTILTEVESLLNSRPLVYVNSEFNVDEPLTPFHLLSGYLLSSLPVPEELLDQDVTYGDTIVLTKRHRHVLNLISKFQKSWKKDYLLNLQQSWSKSGRPQIKEGDVVLLESDGPRLKWKLGVVKTLYTSPDGYTRSVLLHTKNGDITRSILHLYPLEIHSNIYSNSEETLSPPSHVLDSQPEKTYRKANLMAKKRIKVLLQEE